MFIHFQRFSLVFALPSQRSNIQRNFALSFHKQIKMMNSFEIEVQAIVAIVGPLQHAATGLSHKQQELLQLMQQVAENHQQVVDLQKRTVISLNELVKELELSSSLHLQMVQNQKRSLGAIKHLVQAQEETFVALERIALLLERRASRSRF
jgi:Mg2+ and Co2+ transporter CorA